MDGRQGADQAALVFWVVARSHRAKGAADQIRSVGDARTGPGTQDRDAIERCGSHQLGQNGSEDLPPLVLVVVLDIGRELGDQVCRQGAQDDGDASRVGGGGCPGLGLSGARVDEGGVGGAGLKVPAGTVAAAELDGEWVGLGAHGGLDVQTGVERRERAGREERDLVGTVRIRLELGRGRTVEPVPHDLERAVTQVPVAVGGPGEHAIEDGDVVVAGQVPGGAGHGCVHRVRTAAHGNLGGPQPRCGCTVMAVDDDQGANAGQGLVVSGHRQRGGQALGRDTGGVAQQPAQGLGRALVLLADPAAQDGALAHAPGAAHLDELFQAFGHDNGV